MSGECKCLCTCQKLAGIPFATKGCPEHGVWASLCKDMPRGTIMFINTNDFVVEVPDWPYDEEVIPDDAKMN